MTSLLNTTLIDEARSLISTDDSNPEYDRAIAELVCRMLNTEDYDAVLMMLRRTCAS